MYFEEDRSLSIIEWVKKNVVSVMLGGFFYDKDKSRVVTVIHIYLLIVFFAVPIALTFVFEESIMFYIFFPLGVFFFLLIVKTTNFILHIFFDRNERGVSKEMFRLCIPKKREYSRMREENKLEDEEEEEKNDEPGPDDKLLQIKEESDVDSEMKPMINHEDEEIVIDMESSPPESPEEEIKTNDEPEPEENNNENIEEEKENEKTPSEEKEEEEIEEGGEELLTENENEEEEDEKKGKDENEEQEELPEVPKEEETDGEKKEENFESESPEQQEQQEPQQYLQQGGAEPTMETFYFQDETGVIYQYSIVRRDGENDNQPLMTVPQPVAMADPNLSSNPINSQFQFPPNAGVMNSFMSGYYQDPNGEVRDEKDEERDLENDDDDDDDSSSSSSSGDEDENNEDIEDDDHNNLISRIEHKGWIGKEKYIDKSKLFQYSIFGQVIHIYFDRALLETLFDRNVSLLEIFFSLFLGTLLGAFEIHVLYRQEYFLTKLIIAAVTTTCFFSLMKSPQPDTNSFLHHSTTSSFTRPFFFCLFAITYTVFIEVDYYVLPFSSCYKEIPCFIIMFFPIICLAGVLPNYQTFVFYILETFHITVCGGTGIIDFYGLFFFFVVDMSFIICLFSIHYFMPRESQGFGGLHYLRDFIFAAALNGLGYFSSRITNDYVGIRRLFNLHKLGRILKDFVVSFFFAFLGTACMIIPFPPLLYIGSVLFVIGLLQYVILKQFKSFHPFHVFKHPCFCIEFEQFRHLLKIFQYLLSSLEVGLYVFIITSCLNFNVLISSDNENAWHNSLVFSSSAYKLIVMIHTPKLKRCYKILFFSVLYYYFEGNQKLSFIFIMFVFSVIVEKLEELIGKVRYMLVWRNPRSFSRMYHLIFYPTWFPHHSFFIFLVLFSTVWSSPLIPWLGSNFWLISYPRPIKFWERKYKTTRKDLSTMSFYQSLRSGLGSSTFANNLNSIFYEHLCKVLKRNCGGIMEAIGDHLETGDFYIIMNKDPTALTPELTALIHFVEVGDHFLTFQLRGLEFDGTICQSKEQDALLKAVDLKRDNGYCGTRIFQQFKDLRKSLNYTWKVITNSLILKTYRRTEIRAKNMLLGFEGRKLVLKYYPYAIIFLVLRNKRLENWVSVKNKKKRSNKNKNKKTFSRVFEAAEISKIGEDTCDKDPCFGCLNDEFGVTDPDYDGFKGGISFQSFLEVFGSFISFCLHDYRKKKRKRKKRALFKSKFLKKKKKKMKEVEEIIENKSVIQVSVDHKTDLNYDNNNNNNNNDFKDPFDTKDEEEEEEGEEDEKKEERLEKMKKIEEEEEEEEENSDDDSSALPESSTTSDEYSTTSTSSSTTSDNEGSSEEENDHNDPNNNNNNNNNEDDEDDDLDEIIINVNEPEDPEKRYDEQELAGIKLVYKLTVCARKALYSEPGFIYGLKENPRQFIEILYRNISMEINVMDDLWVFEDDLFLKIFSKSLILSLRLFKDSFVRNSYLSEEEESEGEEDEDQENTNPQQIEEEEEEEEVIEINEKEKKTKKKEEVENEEDEEKEKDNQLSDASIYGLYEIMKKYDKNITMCTEHDPEWRKAIVKKEKDSLFTLRKIVDTVANPREDNIGGTKYIFFELTKEEQNFSVIKVNKYSVRSLWASQSNELIFMENQNRERGSIQQFKYGLRNIISSSADIPVGYPAFISPYETGYFHPFLGCISSVVKLGMKMNPKAVVGNMDDYLSIGASGINSIGSRVISSATKQHSYENLEEIPMDESRKSIMSTINVEETEKIEFIEE